MKGTFLAIITTSSVYVILIICLGFTVYPYASGNITEANNDFTNMLCMNENNCPYGLIPDYQVLSNAQSIIFSISNRL